MKLPDVNVFVYAHNSASPRHGSARTALMEAARSGGGLALAWVALLGFLRVSTRPGVFASPLPLPAALHAVHGFMAAEHAVLVNPGPSHARLLDQLLRQAGTAGNLTTDAHLAALAIEHGATLVSFDRDFKRFAGLSLELLS